MPINTVHDTWIQRNLELRPHQRITQVRNFVLLMIGIYKSRSVHLSKIAGHIPSQAKVLSTTSRKDGVGVTVIVGEGNFVGNGVILGVVKEGDCEQPFNKRPTTVNIKKRILFLFL